MARFDSNDQQMLEEAYSQIQEGLWDRFKARGVEALGNVKGAAKQVAGGALSKAGGLASKGIQAAGGQIDPSNNRLSQMGQELSDSGKNSGHNAKVEYLQKNIDKRIQKFVGEIKNDIQKLGLDIGNIEMISGINDALNKLKKSVSVPTPPPLPEPEPSTVEDDFGDDPEDDVENPVEYSYPVRRKKPTQNKQKSKPTVNPKKSKVDPNRLRNRAAAPEQEERFR